MAENDDDQPDYDDGRPLGNWASRYDGKAWVQISLEFLLLAFYLLSSCYFLLESIVVVSDGLAREGFVYSSLLGLYFSLENAKWIALALAGFVGGTVFDLKWLYHSVARGKWNRDRCLWRIIVPFNSGVVSLFTGLLFASGIIPFLRNESFDDMYSLLGFGFVFGYFSDNILAALQNVAKQIFGTLNDG